MNELDNKIEEYKNKIRLKLEGIKLELTEESLKSITEAIINVYTEEFSKFDCLDFKEIEDYIKGDTEEPWESSHEDFGAFWMMPLKPALMKEIYHYKFDDLIDFKFIKKQVYKNIFEKMKENKLKFINK